MNRVKLMSFLIGLLALPAIVSSQSLPAGYTSALGVPYVPGGGLRQQLDVFYPTSGAPAGLVIWVHGGGWNGGSKDPCQALGLLAQERFVIASVNYRFTTTNPFPAQVEDLNSAIRFLKANAASYRIDPSRVGLWGRSAGAHLAALSALSSDTGQFNTGQNLNQSARVQAVVDFFGPTNLALYGSSVSGDPLTQYLGATIQSGPASLAQSNPLNYINAGSAEPPFLIMHRTGDPIVPVGHSQALHNALIAAGLSSTLQTFAGNSHDLPGLTFEPSTPYDAQVAGFFRTSFAAVPEPSSAVALFCVAGALLSRTRRPL